MDAQDTNGVNSAEDSEMAENDAEKVVTMMDVLQEQQDFEDDANAVLGASDDKECTYSKGYIKRQAIYACLTCCSDAKTDPSKRAALCLACSLACHENHELVELYTKRNFRCDCGNPKFNSNPCQFTPEKTEFNDDNIYNQNFSGLYCICSKPYPDPESTVEEEMIQCIICEDWLHATHLDAKLPPSDMYAEMVCKGCMEKNEFLHDYSNFAVNILENDEVDVDDSMTKDFTMNGETEVKVVDDLTMNVESNIKDVESTKIVVEAAEKDISDIAMDESKTEATEESRETKDKPITTDEINESATPALDETTSEENKTDQIVNENSTEEQTTANATENSVTSGSSSEIKEDAKSTAINNEGDCGENAVISTEKAAEDVSEQPEEPANEQKQSLEDKSVPAAEDLNISEKVMHSDVAENDTVSSENDTKTDQGKESSTAPVADDDNKDAENVNVSSENSTKINESKESITEPVADDDNKEIDAIDELLAEGTSEEKSQTDPKSEKSKITDSSTSEEKSSDPKSEKSEINIDSSTSQEQSQTDPKSEINIDSSTSEEKSQTDPTDDKSATNIDSSTDNNESDSKAVDMKEDETKTIGHTEEESSKMFITSDVDMNEGISNEKESSEAFPTTQSLTNGSSNSNDNKRKLSLDNEEETSKKPKLTCNRPKSVKKIFKGATFWPSHFRQKLCTCNECITMYKDLSVLFLIDLEDTVAAYEDLGKARINGAPTTQYEKGLEALSSLDRIQQINALTEYNRMRDKLLDFLKSFKDRKEIVKEEDIRAFFSKMKPKRGPDGVYFCR